MKEKKDSSLIAVPLSLFDKIRSPVCILSKNYDPIYINLKFQDLFGFISLDDFILKGGTTKLFKTKPIHRLLESNEKEKEILFESQNGEWFKSRVTISPIGEEGSELDRFVLLFDTIVSSQKDNTLAFLQKILKNANDAVMITEAEPVEEPGPRILYVNPAFSQITGYEMEEVIGKSPRFLQGPETDRSQLDKIKNALREQKSSKVELINYTKDGKKFWVNFNLFPLTIEDKVAYYISFQRDTTEFRKATIWLSSILDSLPGKMAIVDDEGKIILTNKGWEEFGNEHADVLIGGAVGTNYIELCMHLTEIDPDICKDIVEGLKEVIHGRKPMFVLEYPFTTAQGKIWFRLMINPVRKDFPSEVIVLHVEITERVMMSQNLKKSEQSYKSLFENHPDPICTTDLEGRFTSLNPALARLINIPKDLLLHTSFKDIVHSDILPFLKEQHQKTCEGHAQNFDATVKLLNGQVVIVNITNIPIQISGEVKGVYSIIKDIAEVRRTQQLLEESSNRVNSILESITDGFYALDREFKVTYWNKEAERVLEMKREDILGKLVWDYFPVAEKLRYSEEYKKVLESGKSVHFEEYYPPLKIWTEVNAYPSTEGLSVFFRDITERKKWVEDLQEHTKILEKTNYELDQFVYRASHDLRAPLVSVLGLINIFRLEDSPEKKEEYLNLMSKSINKLDNFIQDIIFYSKNSRTELVLSEIPFEALIEEVVDNIKYMEEARSININTEIPAISRFYSDYSRLSVVLNNLVTNAIRYHDPHKTNQFIKISISLINNKLRIVVEDNGQGIPDKDQEKVFEMFYRASAKTVGSGLGLYIVRENIEKLQGSIDLHSQLGIGTHFTIEIPNLTMLKE